MFYFSLAIAIISAASYHILTRYIPQNVNPFISLIVTYVAALVVAGIGLLVMPAPEGVRAEFGKLNIASALIGLTVVGIELGFIFAYRSGWQVNTASLVVNLAVAIVLILAGFGLFKETLTPTNIVGIVVCLVGMVLVSIK